jgi:ketosteroid isomerase-like protein
MKKGVILPLVISGLILGVCQSAVAGTLSSKDDDVTSDANWRPSASSSDSNPPLDVVKQSYAAFVRGDIPAILNLIADQVDWQDVCPASLPYSGLRRNRAEVAKFFSESAQVDEIKKFEPREFIVAGENVGAWIHGRLRVIRNKNFGPTSYTCSQYKTAKLRVGVASSIPLHDMVGSLKFNHSGTIW